MSIHSNLCSIYETSTLSDHNLTMISISLASSKHLQVTVRKGGGGVGAPFPKKQTKHEPNETRMFDQRSVVVDVAACVTDTANVDVLVVSTKPKERKSCIDAGIATARRSFPRLQFYDLPRNTTTPCQCLNSIC